MSIQAQKMRWCRGSHLKDVVPPDTKDWRRFCQISTCRKRMLHSSSPLSALKSYVAPLIVRLFVNDRFFPRSENSLRDSG